VKKEYGSSFEVALKYYTLFSLLSNWNLTPADLKLLAFTATRGNISSGGAREQFIEQFHSSKASVANIVHKLFKLHYLIKEDGLTRINPSLDMNFSQPLILQLHINGKAS